MMDFFKGKALFLFLFFFPGAFNLQVFSQTRSSQSVADKPLRIEIPAKSDNETYRIISCGKSGVLLFFRSVESVDDNRVKWYFSFYNMDLQQIWTKSVAIANKFEFKSSSIAHDTLALLFNLGSKEKGSDTNFTILRILPGNNEFIENTGLFPGTGIPDKFELIGQKAVIVLNEKDQPAKIMVNDLTNGISNTFQVSDNIPSTILDLVIDSANLQLIVGVMKKMTKNDSECYLEKYDLTGKMASEVLISTINGDRLIQALQLFCSSPRETMIIGTYGMNQEKGGLFRKKTVTGATGYFCSRVIDNLQKSITFFNFLDLKNANSLMDEKEILALHKKAIRKSRDLSDFSLDLNLVLHPLVREGDQFILFSEAYAPEYHSENFTDFDFYGRPFTNSYTIFDGYRYTNAIITAFDHEGNLKWDNNLEIRNLKTYDLLPRVNTYFVNDQVVLTYLSEGKIASKIIAGNTVVEKLDFTPIDLNLPEDKLITETRSKMALWYNNYFLCYGYDEIKNVALAENNRRLVFYLSKVKFE